MGLLLAYSSIDISSVLKWKKMCLDVGISLLSYARGKRRKLSLQLRQKNKRNMHRALLGEATATSWGVFLEPLQYKGLVRSYVQVS